MSTQGTHIDPVNRLATIPGKYSDIEIDWIVGDSKSFPVGQFVSSLRYSESLFTITEPVVIQFKDQTGYLSKLFALTKDSVLSITIKLGDFHILKRVRYKIISIPHDITVAAADKENYTRTIEIKAVPEFYFIAANLMKKGERTIKGSGIDYIAKMLQTECNSPPVAAPPFKIASPVLTDTVLPGAYTPLIVTELIRRKLSPFVSIRYSAIINQIVILPEDSFRTIKVPFVARQATNWEGSVGSITDYEQRQGRILELQSHTHRPVINPVPESLVRFDILRKTFTPRTGDARSWRTIYYNSDSPLERIQIAEKTAIATEKRYHYPTEKYQLALSGHPLILPGSELEFELQNKPSPEPIKGLITSVIHEFRNSNWTISTVINREDS